MTIASATATVAALPATPMRAIALRLIPGQDLLHELAAVAQHHQLTAACILTCVGSLTQATLRLANQGTGTTYQGPFEILSLTGVMSIHGGHYHLAIADAQGQTSGGHLLPGCIIYTTAEIVIGVLPNLCFDRQPCPQSGYPELVVSPQPTSDSEPVPSSQAATLQS